MHYIQTNKKYVGLPRKNKVIFHYISNRTLRIVHIILKILAEGSDDQVYVKLDVVVLYCLKKFQLSQCVNIKRLSAEVMRLNGVGSVVT